MELCSRQPVAATDEFMFIVTFLRRFIRDLLIWDVFLLKMMTMILKALVFWVVFMVFSITTLEFINYAKNPFDGTYLLHIENACGGPFFVDPIHYHPYNVDFRISLYPNDL